MSDLLDRLVKLKERLVDHNCLNNADIVADAIIEIEQLRGAVEIYTGISADKRMAVKLEATKVMALGRQNKERGTDDGSKLLLGTRNVADQKRGIHLSGFS